MYTDHNDDCMSEDIGRRSGAKSSAILTRSADANATYYYWYKGEKIALTLNSNYVNVVVENDLAKSASTQSLAQSYSLIQEENERCGNIITLKLATKTVSSEYEKLVADLKQDERVKHVLPFFNRGAATPIGTSDIFYLKLKTVNDIATLEALTKEQNIRIVKEVPNMPLWYIPVYSKFFFRKFGSCKQLLLRNAKIRRGRSCFYVRFQTEQYS